MRHVGRQPGWVSVSLQFPHHVARRLPSLAGILCETSFHDIFQPSRD
jgi:hypothetical protein